MRPSFKEVSILKLRLFKMEQSKSFLFVPSGFSELKITLPEYPTTSFIISDNSFILISFPHHELS